MKVKPVNHEIVCKCGGHEVTLKNGIKIKGDFKTLKSLSSPVQVDRKKAWKCLGR